MFGNKGLTARNRLEQFWITRANRRIKDRNAAAAKLSLLQV